MARVHAVVEGQTEEVFVKRVLAPRLGEIDVFIDARSVETSRQRTKVYRGGVLDYRRLKGDLLRWMGEDDHSDCYFTTMIDLYRLPPDFPRYEDSRRQADPYARVALLEEAFHVDLGHARFIPYLQLHEFEALLLADPRAFDLEFSEHRGAIDSLVNLAGDYESPDLINEGPESAPSKRIIAKLPPYEGRKVSAGPVIAERIGLDNLRQRCRHFHEWLVRMESLGAR